MDNWRVAIDGDEVSLTRGDATGRHLFVPGSRGKIKDYAFGPGLPAEYWEVSGFERVHGGPVTVRDAFAFAYEMFRALFRICDGLPILAAMSRRHAEIYLRMLPRLGFRVSVVGGSMYDGVVLRYRPPGVDGGSDDQVLMVTEVTD